jgi:serine/threonine protein kinase
MSNHFALMYRIAVGEHLPTIPSHISEHGRDFISKCLNRNASDRPSIHELAKHPFIN